MASVEHFIGAYRRAGAPDSLRGYEDVEIRSLESQYGVELPPSFIAYLTVLGHSTDLIFLGTDTSLYYLRQLRDWADELLIENGTPFRLHAKDFVFLMHQGYQFMWFRADGSSDDPPVYYYLEGYDAPEKRFRSFSAYIESCIAESFPPL